jgi:hypothetical protein
MSSLRDTISTIETRLLYVMDLGNVFCYMSWTLATSSRVGSSQRTMLSRGIPGNKTCMRHRERSLVLAEGWEQSQTRQEKYGLLL